MLLTSRAETWKLAIYLHEITGSDSSYLSHNTTHKESHWYISEHTEKTYIM